MLCFYTCMNYIIETTPITCTCIIIHDLLQFPGQNVILDFDKQVLYYIIVLHWKEGGVREESGARGGVRASAPTLLRATRVGIPFKPQDSDCCSNGSPTPVADTHSRIRTRNPVNSNETTGFGLLFERESNSCGGYTLSNQNSIPRKI